MYRYIYGPVSSWRLGRSLGVDPLSRQDKICSFNCLYCQLGEALAYELERRVFVATTEIIEEIERLPKIEMDYLTLSGRGESTLAENLGEIVESLRRFRKEPVAVLTNSSLMNRDDVRKELSLADLVVVKLDAPSQRLFERINRPAKGVNLGGILEGIKRFREEYRTRLALQIMFIGENKDQVNELASLAFKLQPDEIQINTPLRPSPIKPLSKEAISKIRGCFKGLNTISVYNAERKGAKPLNLEDTIKRRGVNL
ncbi:TPA: radical SAM protein [bacterium]|nr:radical SAM protein [bacterium]